MALTFYPYENDLEGSTVESRLEHFMAAAEQYKSIIMGAKLPDASSAPLEQKMSVPRDLTHAYNWDQLARLLRELREIPEQNSVSRATKANALTKLAAVYEVLCSAKMPKLEAVRLALLSEGSQLRKGLGSG